MSKISAGRVFENYTYIANKRQYIRFNTYRLRNNTNVISIERPLQTTVAARRIRLPACRTVRIEPTRDFAERPHLSCAKLNRQTMG
jgi:hypothetical protein